MLKLLQKSSPEPIGGFTRNLVCTIWDSSQSVCSNDEPGMTCFMASSILETKAFTWEKAKTMDILETVSAGDEKRTEKLNFAKSPTCFRERLEISCH